MAVLRATLDLLAGVGFTELTVEAVAERSGVHKTTIYRRWESREGLVAAALRFGADEPWSPADTGSLVADLRQLALEVVHALTTPGQRELPTAAVLAAFHSERAAEALREFYRDRHARAAVIVERAVARGEVPADTDPDEVTRTVCGPVFYRLFVSREPVSEATAAVAAEAGAAAARAGVLGRRAPGKGDAG